MARRYLVFAGAPTALQIERERTSSTDLKTYKWEKETFLLPQQANSSGVVSEPELKSGFPPLAPPRLLSQAQAQAANQSISTLYQGLFPEGPSDAVEDDDNYRGIDFDENEGRTNGALGLC